MSMLMKWNPFRELDEVQNRFGRFFGGFPTGLREGNGETLTLPDWSPQVDITEDDQEYLIKADLPEMKKEDVKVVSRMAFSRSLVSARLRRRSKERSITVSNAPTAVSGEDFSSRRMPMEPKSKPSSRTVS